MKIGDKVRCTYSSNHWFTKGKEYEILSFDRDGDPNFRDDEGDYGKECGYPLNGMFWQFEVAYND